LVTSQQLTLHDTATAKMKRVTIGNMEKVPSDKPNAPSKRGTASKQRKAVSIDYRHYNLCC